MKTSKKIVALMLAMCMIFSLSTMMVSAKYVYNTNDLWDQWDENGQMVLKANINLGEGAASINFNGAVDSALLFDAVRYTVSFDFVVPGESPITLPVRNAGIQGYDTRTGVSTVWFSSVLPITSGTIRENMIADAETDEVLRGLLAIEDANPDAGIEGGVICKDDNTNKPVINGEQASETYTALSKRNLIKYVGYKADGVDGVKDSYHNTDVTVTITSNYTVDYDLPHGSFLIDENDLETFPYSWAVSGTHYTTGNATIVTAMKDGGANLDLSYGVFEAPATGTYNVFAYKRDRAESVGTASNRDLHISINDEAFYFPCDNSPTAASSSPAYYWEIENAHREDRATKTVSLIKGQKFVVRIPRNNRAYVGCYGFAFVPVEAEMTADGMNAISAELPSSGANFKNYGMESYLESETKATVTVTVNGKEITAVADTSNDSFPNSRLTDASGNFIEGVTVLDALACADAEDEKFALTAGTWDTANSKWVEGNVVNGNFTDTYITKLNGYYCPDMDRQVLKDGDIIECGAADIMKLTLSANGGASTSYGDVVARNGAANKFNINSGHKLPHIVADSTELDAYAGYYLVGYAPLLLNITETTGDDRLSFNRINIPILASGYKSDGTTLQFGYNVGPANNNVDGKTYSMGGFSSGKIQVSPLQYDLTHTYVSKNALPEKATIKAVETVNGVILYTDAPASVGMIRVTKDASGAIASTKVENKVLDFMGGGQFVPVAPGETLYIWRGLQITTGTSAIPVCAPIVK